MEFLNLNISSKTLQIISLITTLIGIIFILASKYIGSIAIRIVMLIIFAISLYNLKNSYKYIDLKEKINHILLLITSILIFIKPEYTMFILGVSILILVTPIIYNILKEKDYSDKIKLPILIIVILFSIYCIIFSKAALNTIIKILGIIFIILGCLIFLNPPPDPL